MARFKPGQSGNPKGKPAGTRHKSTILADKLSSDDVSAVVKAVKDAAKGGDMTAARIILDRLSPAPRSRVIDLGFRLSDIDPAEAIMKLADAVAEGIITPGEGQQLTAIIESRIKAVEIAEIERRLGELEARS